MVRDPVRSSSNVFQSSPDPRAECCQRRVAGVEGADVLVSILTRP